MIDQQLSFLISADLNACDVNAVDCGVIIPGSASVPTQFAALLLAERTVDDWVFGLGFTNWKVVIDHALQTGHYELYDSEDGLQGLRKHGYRYAPIPRLPVAGAIYIKQQLLLIACAKLSRKRLPAERFISAGEGVSYKCSVTSNTCDVQVKIGPNTYQASVAVNELCFSELAQEDVPSLTLQFSAVLSNAGCPQGLPLNSAARAIAIHLARLFGGVR
jgi:hypothetical protein